MQEAIDEIIMERLPVHDELVKEVKLLPLRLFTDVRSPNPMLDEPFHLRLVQEELIVQVLTVLQH